MCSEEPNMTEILFNIQTNNQEYWFTQGMLSEELGMTKVLFSIQTSN